MTSVLPSQDVKPYLVATAMARTAISSSGMVENTRFVPDPVTYTRAAVATIGIQHTTYGYFYHALQVGISVAMVTDLRQQLLLCREGMLFPTHLPPDKLSNTCGTVKWDN